ncbi:hypothetical protein [Streptomyces sp. NPDC005573]|uniref:hypothetical protein n=1 Tax=Streptomyces sp. NPDC005573 TaxID=3156890 RepID=UPI0033BC24AA
MSAFLQQLPALIGVVIGALGSCLAAVRGDRARFRREERRDPGAWQALLERQRSGREGYCAAVREDLELPPGHPARRPVPGL